jgi:hypothetical protein
MTRAQYEARIRELVAQARTSDRQAATAARQALAQAHDDLLREIARLPSDASSYSRYQLTELRRATERAMDDFDRRLASTIQSAQASTYGTNGEGVDRILRDAIGAPPSLLGLDPNRLLIAQGYTADLVTNLSNEARTRLNATLSRAFLGGQSVTDIIKDIGRAVDGGQFGVISRRAETIYRTEVLRVGSMATQARLEQAVANGIPAKKMWVHAGTPVRVRMYHLGINRAVVDVDETFAGSGPNGEDLMYPRDPGGAAADTVNCGCQIFPWVEGFEKFGGVTTPA